MQNISNSTHTPQSYISTKPVDFDKYTQEIIAAFQKRAGKIVLATRPKKPLN